MAFFLTVAGQQKGPHNKDEIRILISEGTVSLDDLVWVAERNRWLQIKFYPEIASLFQKVAKQRKSVSEEYIINVDGKTGGPFPEETVIEEIDKGRLKNDHFIWVQDQNKWLHVKDHPVFSSFFTTSTTGSISEKAKRHYIGKDGARFGPFTEDEIKSSILIGEFLGEHYYWDHTDNKWVDLGSVSEYSNSFKEYETSLEPEEPPPPQTKEPEIEVIPVPVTSVPETPGPIPASLPELEIEVTPQLDIAPVATMQPPVNATETVPAVAPTEVITPVTQLSEDEREPGTIIDIERPVGVDEDESSLPVISTEETLEIQRPAQAPALEEIEIDISDDFEPSNVVWFKRVGAGFIDLFIPSLSFFVSAIIFEVIGRNPYAPGPEQELNAQLFYGITVGFIILYFLLHDSFGGGGLGKRIMGYRIVGERSPHSYGNMLHSIIRNLFVLIPVLNIIDLYLVITNPKGKRIVDNLFNTVAMEKIEIDYIRDKQSTVDSIYQ